MVHRDVKPGNLRERGREGRERDEPASGQFLHGRESAVVHRDVKPGNLLATGDLATLKLADFGVRLDLTERERQRDRDRERVRRDCE